MDSIPRFIASKNNPDKITYKHPALEPILVSYPISWGITSLLYLIYYFRGNWLRRGIAKAGFPAEEDRDSTAAK